MKKVQTHFEQIAVAVVKKIADEEFPEDKVIDEVAIARIPARKSKPHVARVRWVRRSGA